MTTAINQSFGSNVPAFNKANTSDAKKSPTITAFLQGQFKVGGLFGDCANVLKLMNFWTESLTGSITDSSRKMTDAGCILKNYVGALEFPDKVAQISKHLNGLSKGTAESVAEFANSIFCAGKSFFDGVELAGTRFGLLSKEFVSNLSLLNPMGTFSFAATELALRTVPELSVADNINDKVSGMMKLAKQVALLAVATLSLIATFFKPVCAPWVIPTLLTVYITNQIAGRFFDGLIKNA